MRIKVWGCRGSLPTPGSDTVRYGGNTTCLEIRLNDGTLIIADAGSGIRRLGTRLLAEEELTELYLFVTHAHWDHLTGFPFFRPAYLSKYRIHVRGGPRAKRSLAKYLERQMEPPFFPVPFKAMKAAFDFTGGDPRRTSIGSAEIIPIRLNHPGGGYGFKLIEDNRAFVFLPDNELDLTYEHGMTKEEYIDLCRGAALLMHDAQYTDDEYESSKVGWGHSKLSSTVDLGIRAGVQHLGMFHHDPDHTDDEIDGYVALCRNHVRQAGSKVQCFGAKEGMEIIV
jgi:phosphoribosyl 1,2-cyclic phosphodiesterase